MTTEESKIVKDAIPFMRYQDLEEFFLCPEKRVALSKAVRDRAFSRRTFRKDLLDYIMKPWLQCLYRVPAT